MKKDTKQPASFSSPPCFAHELESGDDGDAALNPAAKVELARWRKAERARLLKLRLGIRADLKQLVTEIGDEIIRLINPQPDLIVSVYWPLPSELDFRDWMLSMIDLGVGIALPVVITRGQPMIFREWTPTARMERGIWNIPFPADGEPIIPDVVIAPLVGFDAGCYRLGYGGGYFDRTLAGLRSRPMVIGVGPTLCEIPTIYPQPHDIPMDVIVTGAGQVRFREKTA